MPYALKIATRYLTAAKAQTALLVFGVAIGVFIFMSALIGGLAEFIMSRTAGDMAHITIRAEAVELALLVPAAPGTVLLVQGPSGSRDPEGHRRLHPLDRGPSGGGPRHERSVTDRRSKRIEAPAS